MKFESRVPPMPRDNTSLIAGTTRHRRRLTSVSLVTRVCGDPDQSGRTGIGRICAVRQTMGEGDCIVKNLAVAPYCRAGLIELWLSDSPPASNIASVSTQAHK